jgi:hypothetical protein
MAMTINSLQLNESTVVGGLGTQTFNVVTAGPYTMAFKAFLPFLASGGQPQSTSPSPVVSDITTVADVAGSLNSTFFTFNSAGDLYPYYVWYNINSAGVDPAPAGRIGIQVAGATGATANTLATATRAAITAAAGSQVTVTGATNHVILTTTSSGTSTAAADGTAATGFGFSITAGSYGVPPASGLDVVIKQGSTVLARFGFPSPTQPIMGGSVFIQASANDVLTIVLSSLSTADAALNAVKTIVNLFQGLGQ